MYIDNFVEYEFLLFHSEPQRIVFNTLLASLEKSSLSISMVEFSSEIFNTLFAFVEKLGLVVSSTLSRITQPLIPMI